MIQSIPRKRGRPVSSYRAADGRTIVGLSRQADGRWRISATGEVFFEPDEGLAIARFEERTSTAVEMLELTTPVNDVREAIALVSLRSPALEFGGNVAARPRLQFGTGGTEPLTVVEVPEDKHFFDRILLKSMHELYGTSAPDHLPPPIDPEERARSLEAMAAGRPVSVTRPVPAAEYWATMRWLILHQPALVAHKTGIEQIAWLKDLKRPTPSHTLEEIGTYYLGKPKLSGNEASHAKKYWGEFCNATGVRTVRDLEPEHVEQYEKFVLGLNRGPRTTRNRYNKVRTVLKYALERGKSREDCRRALDNMAMLKVEDHTPMDPVPISRSDFWAIHQAAVDAGDHVFAALMMTALNCAMYDGEVAALRWDNINLRARTLVARRPKSKVSRVAVLWDETVEAIYRLPRDRDTIYNTRVRSYTVYSVVDQWAKYRVAAGVDEKVVFSHIRDAAFTLASEVTANQASALAGHRIRGVTDHYLRRHPRFVARACKAIHRHFFPPPAARHRPAAPAS